MKKQLSALLAMLFILIPLSSVAQAEEAIPTKAEIESSVSFRDQPSTSSNVMRYLKTGEVVTILSMINPNWFHIQDQYGKVGYVSSNSKYISLSSNAKIIYGVNFRTAPSTDSAKIRQLSSGEEILVLEKVNDYWYKAKDQNGVVGFLSSSTKYTAADFSVTKIALPLEERIESIIQAAAVYMGAPYVFGSERFETSTFDCSDLVQQAFWDAARTVLPSDSRGQADYVKAKSLVVTDWNQLKRGDLMFFMSYQGSSASDYETIDKSTETITHVAIYLGNGDILHTYSPESGGVRYDTIVGRHWEYRFLFGGSATN
jgi:cell wall-associated NlpC family hydrolase